MSETQHQRRPVDVDDPVEELRCASALTSGDAAELHELRGRAAELQRERAAIVLERAAIDEERVRLLDQVRAAEAATGDLRHAQNLERDAWTATAAEHRAETDGLRVQLEQADVTYAERSAERDIERDAWAVQRAALEARIGVLESELAATTARLANEVELRQQAERWSIRHRAGVLAHKLPFVGRRRLPS